MQLFKKRVRTPEQRKRRKRLLLITACTLALILSIPFLIDHHVRASAAPYILLPEEAAGLDADCILVLGAGVRDDGTPSLVLNDRLERGIALYQQGASGRLLMSGDHGRIAYDEVNAMKEFAIDRGVLSSHIFMDHAGFSTYESMVRAAEVFQAERVVIVTQSFHLPRALYIARSIGLDAYGVAADLRTYSGMAYTNAREFLARVKDYFYTILRPAPKYLGDAIPVSGNGDLTNDKS